MIKLINEIYCEALAQYDYGKMKWCMDYIRELRSIIFHKYDEISAQILTYIENYTKYSEAELEEIKLKGNAQANKRGDISQKAEILLNERSADIHFGIWGNVQAKSVTFRKINFEVFQCAIPRQHASQHLILRCIWTSFDNVSGDNKKKFDYITVGGVGLCRMFVYPEPPRKTLQWTMRKIQSIDDSLKVIPYPDPSSSVQTDDVKASYVLPDYVFTTEKDEIKVGVWDEDQQCWSMDYIEDL